MFGVVLNPSLFSKPYPERVAELMVASDVKAEVSNVIFDLIQVLNLLEDVAPTIST